MICKVHLLCEIEYVIPSVGNFAEEESCVCLNSPSAYEHRKSFQYRIKELSDDDLTVYVVDTDALWFP
jgi:hypothetical protein